jgi:hypothetical protein
LVWVAFFILVPVWLLIGAGIAFWDQTWDAWSGYASWGRDLFMVSIVPTLAREASEAIQKKTTAPAVVSITTTEGQ